MSPVSAGLTLIKSKLRVCGRTSSLSQRNQERRLQIYCCIPDGLYGKEEQYISYRKSTKKQTSFILTKGTVSLLTSSLREKKIEYTESCMVLPWSICFLK